MRCAKLVIIALVGLWWAVPGCQSPLGPDYTSDLRRMVIASAKADLAEDPRGQREQRLAAIYPPEIARELDELSDPQRRADQPPALGESLDGSSPKLVAMSLSQAIVAAAQHNLDGQLARVIPSIRQTEVVEAQAAFDVVAFGDANIGKEDRPLAASRLNGVNVGSDATKRETARLEAGLRKRIEQSGATIAAATGADYINDQSPRLDSQPDPGWTANVGLTVTQPLLRDFGEHVTGANVKLAQNARRRDVLGVEQSLLSITGDTETAYWQLALAQYELAIRKQLLEQTRQTRDEVKARRQVDANPVQVAQANAQVNGRQIDVLRAESAVREASDRLKRLLNSPDLPLAGETVIHATSYPNQLPEHHDLSHALTHAIRRRPDLAQILIEVDDTHVRGDVARNQQLPRLDLTGEVRRYGLDESLGGGYRELDDDFVEYLVGLRYEQPIGHRAADAAYQRTRLTRQAQTIRYRNAAQAVVLEVKAALRRMQTNYQVLQVARSGRRAAAENLRALEEREKTGQELTPEFLLDLKLRTQQRLAEAQIAEVRAAADYSIARARYYQQAGLLLGEHDVRIDHANDAPDPSETKR